MAIWAEWLKPSAGLPTVQWSLLLALAAAAGHLVQRLHGPAQGGGLFDRRHARRPGRLRGRGLAAAGHRPVPAGAGRGDRAVRSRRPHRRCAGSATTRWCWCKACSRRRSPTSACTACCAGWTCAPASPTPLALIAMAASPAVLSRVVIDTRAAGPVTERAMVLADAEHPLRAHARSAARAGVMHREETAPGRHALPGGGGAGPVLRGGRAAWRWRCARRCA